MKNEQRNLNTGREFEMKDVSMTVADGAVCVFDGYKTVCFLKEELKGKSEEVRGRSEEVIVKSEEVLVRILDDILPSEAARLYIEYLELIRSCPRYRTEKAVNCKDKLSIDNGKLKIENEELQRGELQMKPKKIKIRILEGEVVV